MRSTRPSDAAWCAARTQLIPARPPLPSPAEDERFWAAQEWAPGYSHEPS